MSVDYIDGKRAIASARRLRRVGQAINDVASQNGIEFDAVGGLTMGADPLALAVALSASDEEIEWFSVRKEAKAHGKQKLIEGAALGPQSKVLVVDDVVTTGGSIIKAIEAIRDVGAEVVLAVALVDRSDATGKRLEQLGIRYIPLMTYQELGIDPVRC